MHAGQLVFAGTFMQTFTRLTTMEAANESARHAVNAILGEYARQGGRMIEPCQIWNPEDYELTDLRYLIDLDERLFAARQPHVLDGLDLSFAPGARQP
jgi:hypothetical protein